jgi:tetratricopeptide (TPR) repeat protein
VLGAERLPEGLATLIHERTDGNPFFLEEVCHALTEEGIVRIENGQVVLTRSLQQLMFPETVQAVVRARLDRLDRQAQDTLRLAAVIGREFTRRLLEHIHTASARLLHSLEDLMALELIQQIRLLPEAVFMFKHVITQQVTYDTLRLQQRQLLHGLVAQAIEALYTDRQEDQVEALAYHYRHSTNAEKALHYLELAGDKAASYYALDDAKQQYREALAILDAMAMTPERQQYRIDLSLKWAELVAFEPATHDILVLHTSLAYAQTLQDQSRLAHTTFWLGRMQYYLGQMPEAHAHFQQCLEWAEVLQSEEFLVLPYNSLGRSFLLNNDFPKLIAYLEKGIPMAERTGNQREVSTSSFYLGLGYAWTGKFTPALANVEKAMAVAKTAGDLYALAWSTYAMGYVKVLHGDWEEAMRHLHDSMAVATRIGAHALVAADLAVKGYVTFMLGERENGIALMEEGIRLIEATDHRFLLTLLLGWLAELYALAGSRADATRCGSRALQCMKDGMRYGELIVHRALALAAGLASPPDWGRVEAHMQDAIHLAEAKAAHQALALAYFRYAELLRAKGDLAQARDYLRQATGLFAEMGMAWWLAQAETLRERLGVN